MGRLNRLIIRWSYRWWSIALAIVAFALSFWFLFVIGERFAIITNGNLPFDLQNPLSVAEIHAQLPFYTAASSRIYWGFIAADTIFPLLGGVMLSLLVARTLHSIGTRWSSRLLASGGPLFPLVGAILDWVENIFFVATIALYPRDITGWATLAVATKSTKVAFLVASNVVLVSLAGYTLIRHGTARR